MIRIGPTCTTPGKFAESRKIQIMLLLTVMDLDVPQFVHQVILPKVDLMGQYVAKENGQSPNLLVRLAPCQRFNHAQDLIQCVLSTQETDG